MIHDPLFIHTHRLISQGQISCSTVWFVLKWPSAAMALSFTYSISLLYLSMSPHTQDTIVAVFLTGYLWSVQKDWMILAAYPQATPTYVCVCVCVIESDRAGKNICPRFRVLDVCCVMFYWSQAGYRLLRDTGCLTLPLICLSLVPLTYSCYNLEIAVYEVKWKSESEKWSPIYDGLKWFIYETLLFLN